MTTIEIPRYVADTVETIHQNNYEVYIVGGSIRDSFLGREPHDWDLCTNETPEMTYNLFKDKSDTQITCAGISHGTLKIWVGDNEPIDVTTYGYNPRYVSSDDLDRYYKKTIQDDLLRRDFTMNAIAYSPYKGIVDPYNGISAIKEKKIQFIDSPRNAIRRDPYLILRAIRQAITLRFNIDREGLVEVIDIRNISLIRDNVSHWRVGKEIRNIMFSDNDDTIYFDVFMRTILPNILPSSMIRRGYNNEDIERIRSYDPGYKRLYALLRMLGDIDEISDYLELDCEDIDRLLDVEDELRHE